MKDGKLYCGVCMKFTFHTIEEDQGRCWLCNALNPVPGPDEDFSEEDADYNFQDRMDTAGKEICHVEQS